jgi:hypothetical protein
MRIFGSCVTPKLESNDVDLALIRADDFKLSVHVEIQRMQKEILDYLMLYASETKSLEVP